MIDALVILAGALTGGLVAFLIGLPFLLREMRREL